MYMAADYHDSLQSALSEAQRESEVLSEELQSTEDRVEEVAGRVHARLAAQGKELRQLRRVEQELRSILQAGAPATAFDRSGDVTPPRPARSRAQRRSSAPR